MNLFNNFKETITSVKKDLTIGFQQKNFKQDEKVHELLARYAQYWKEFSLNTDSMGKQAETCDKILTNLSNTVIQKKNYFFQFTAELKSLDKVVAEVETIKIRLYDVKKSCELLEMLLCDVEMLNEKCKHAAILQNMGKMFNHHRLTKLKEHEKNKRLLKEHHNKNLMKLKEEMMKRKCERQKVFEEVHNQEMGIYRTFGSISYSLSASSTPDACSLDLSEITFEDDTGNKELEDFLGDPESSSDGDKHGDIIDDEHGDVIDDEHGDHIGDKHGDIIDDKHGDHIGDKHGDIIDDKHGDIIDDKHGDHIGDKHGDHIDDEHGDHIDDEHGDHIDDEHGDIIDDKHGDIIDDEHVELCVGDHIGDEHGEHPPLQIDEALPPRDQSINPS